MASRVAQFFEAYRSGYLRHAVEDLADLFAYPSLVTADPGEVVTVPNPTRSEWLPQLGQLLDMYAAIGVKHIDILELEERQLSPRLWLASVHWGLRDAGGSDLYDFHNVYVLGEVGGRLRITSAVSPDELPRYRACRQRLGV
jgi:hypothetical protein